ncbi:flagellar basal body P-ring formation chaperone FlgA [Roseateles sp.]|uniref:flagellar basal body P-ring formation chaperone FlgA n=1 Tax=Roseateles sp. TaxID=1971397 RepID=UPI0039E86A40
MLRSPRNLLWGLLALPVLTLAAGLEAQVQDAARRAVLEAADREGWVAPELQFAPQATRPAPACNGGWDVTVQDARSLSRLRLAARCPGSPAVPAQSFVLRASLSAEVLVARQAVAVGQALADGDVELQRRDISQTSDALGRLEDVLGQAPRSSLRPGQILQKRQLAPAQLVRRGERVRIVAHSEGIEVQGAGEALDAGARDAVIRVRNSASGRVISARVLDAGLVEPVR